MSTKDYSSQQESMVATKLGWKVVAGSGAAACFPGDVIGDDWLGECKTHMSSGQKIFFKRSHWDKIKEEAIMKHRHPVLITDDGTQKERATWCLCMQSSLEGDHIHTVGLTTGVNVNISLDDTSMKEIVKDTMRNHPGDNCIFIATWGKDPVAICTLSTFEELVRE